MARELLYHGRFTFQFRFNIIKRGKPVNKLNKQVGVAAVLGLGMVVAGVAAASPVTMNFDDLAVPQNGGQYVAAFYDGGCGVSFNGGAATCGGPDYGVTWTGPAVVRGPLNIPSADSAPNALMRATPAGVPLGTAPMTMDVANGFTDGFSFYYATLTRATTFTVTFYSGLGGTGRVLGTERFHGCSLPAGLYTCWTLADGFSFSDAVYSVAFGGGATFAIDGVSFDMRAAPPVGVPEPTALGTFGLGLLAVGVAVGLRRRRAFQA